uniref:PEP-CTERM protein-sorting domain-containing protein n=1 Tax=uncultured Armatimonadetes bacterium TaxID=157466 RepID=A0A6J4JJ68_9BACT|nr:hypothetical protein AVDCRST_MAG63-3573 [uncultured Armatimonadetes bacterium]
MEVNHKHAPAVVAGLALFCLAAAAPARAQVTFTLGNSPQQPGQENVLLNTGQTGSTIFGELNQSGTPVGFSSITDILTAPSNGQARVEAVDTILNNVSIFVPDGSFTTLIANPFLGGRPNLAGGPLTIFVETSAGNQTFLPTLGNGQNFFTLVADEDVTIDRVTLTSATGFNDLRQVRLSVAEPDGPGGEAIPEPGTCALLASTLLPLTGAVLRRRRGA